MTLRVLLGEDNPADVDLTMQALQRAAGPPLEVVPVGTLHDALNHLASQSFDVVLSDLNLPDSQGLETVRALGGLSRAPVVAHTGAVDEAQGLAAVEAGADDFVVKGTVSGARLRQVLQFAAQRRSTTVALEAAQKKAAEQQDLLAAATKANRFKADFLNMASHELGNPLTPIRLQLATMRALLDKHPDPRLNTALDLLGRNVTRLTGLIQDMLEIGRIQAKTLDYKWTEEDLASLCSEAVTGMRQLGEASRIDLVLEGPAGMRVRIDRERFSQVLLNLLSNAIKYTPGPGKATLRFRQEGASAVVEVEDTGRGIGAGDVPHLFSPFTRLGDIHAVKGTGLGLYICKGFVEAHGGSIAARSAGLGKGAVFTVRVPLTGPAQVETNGALPSLPGGGAA